MKIDQEILQQYLDGELDPLSHAYVDNEIAMQPEWASELARLKQLRNAVHISETEILMNAPWSNPAYSDDLYRSIEQNLNQTDTSHMKQSGHLRLLPGGKIMKSGIAAAGFIALAAAVFLTFQTPNFPQMPENISPSSATSVTTRLNTSTQTSIAPRGSHIISVEFGKNTGTHFSLEGASGEPLAVIWIHEEPSAETTTQ